MEHQELIHLAKQLHKVRHAKKPYYFYFVLHGVDQAPALFVERKPSDARRKGVAVTIPAKQKMVAHGRVELRSRRAVFINETTLSSRKIRKAFRQHLCQEKELRSAYPVLKTSEIISVEDDLALTVEASPTAIQPEIQLKMSAPDHAGTKAPVLEDGEAFIGRWDKLHRLTSRRLGILSRKAESLKSTQKTPLQVIQDVQERVLVLLDQFDNSELEYQNGQPKIAIQILVNVHSAAKELKEQLDALPNDAQDDSFEQEMGWVKLVHRSWTQLLDHQIDGLEIPLLPLCEPLTEALDRLLMSTNLEELDAHRRTAIDAVVKVQYDVSNSNLLPQLEDHPRKPLTSKTGLFPTLNQILNSLGM